ncbi:hypothetical protein VINI7043_18469 [Vibrio nigripulchritudo ATCC 27043]|uniref:hypothetical protein n=1 Tax=Vibrio nigripulchritudo TaxID=28173 RepID=UPI00021C1FCB|nr:hypothetical protein [Vibrio nigripulchritudo]EGU55604.1 hypothetical protein VINI7043_18469 [Vibrio nigripulchritudo ATCC 27043]
MPNQITQGQRYLDSELRDKLAGEYALGTQTPRVRRRLEQLMDSDPTWWEHIESWHSHLAGLNPATELFRDSEDLAAPPKRVWNQIEASTFNIKKSPQGFKWWWLSTAMTLSLLIGTLIQPVLMPVSTIPDSANVRPVSYLAMMSSESHPNHFALVAYQGDKPGESNIQIQFNLGLQTLPMAEAVVWMKDKTTGELKLIDSLANIQKVRFMSPTEWKALKNSSELLVTMNENPNSRILYRGECVELSQGEVL